MALSIAMVYPYADPERGACAMRVESLRTYFLQQGASVIVHSPNRQTPASDGVQRYAGMFQLRQALRRQNPDIILGSSPPMTDTMAAFLWGAFSGKKLFLDIRDPWTHALNHLGTYRQKPLKLFLYRAIEKWASRLARRIFVVTPGIEKILLAQGVQPSKIMLAPNGTLAHFFHFDSLARTKFRRQWGVSDDRPVLIYSGEFMDLGLGDVLENLASVLLEKKAVLVLLIPLDEREKKAAVEIVERAQNAGLKGSLVVENIRPLNPGEISGRMSAADFGLAINPIGFDYCIPARIYDYCASGLFSLAMGPAQSDLEKLLTTHSIGAHASGPMEFAATVLREMSHLPTGPDRIQRQELAHSLFDRKRTAQLIWEEISKK